MDAEKRILQERENWRRDRPFGFVAKPVAKEGGLDLFNWECTVPGPEGSPFAGHNIHLHIEFFKGYPITPPQAKFLSKVFHPNVYTDGFICLDILGNGAWTPSMNIKSILLAISSLLSTPNVDSPANNEAAELYNRSKSLYSRKVKSFLKA
ncbi:ubiquitin-conjugating enzyme E2 I [Nematocida sp. AWRm77]|nr:ubiquitin-conjugating enzyme E2 I [Nematocida sp. AWRm77]